MKYFKKFNTEEEFAQARVQDFTLPSVAKIGDNKVSYDLPDFFKFVYSVPSGGKQNVKIVPDNFGDISDELDTSFESYLPQLYSNVDLEEENFPGDTSSLCTWVESFCEGSNVPSPQSNPNSDQEALTWIQENIFPLLTTEQGRTDVLGNYQNTDVYKYISLLYPESTLSTYIGFIESPTIRLYREVKSMYLLHWKYKSYNSNTAANLEKYSNLATGIKQRSNDSNSLKLYVLMLRDTESFNSSEFGVTISETSTDQELLVTLKKLMCRIMFGRLSPEPIYSKVNVDGVTLEEVINSVNLDEGEHTIILSSDSLMGCGYIPQFTVDSTVEEIYFPKSSRHLGGVVGPGVKKFYIGRKLEGLSRPDDWFTSATWTLPNLEDIEIKSKSYHYKNGFLMTPTETEVVMNLREDYYLPEGITHLTYQVPGENYNNMLTLRYTDSIEVYNYVFPESLVGIDGGPQNIIFKGTLTFGPNISYLGLYGSYATSAFSQVDTVYMLSPTPPTLQTQDDSNSFWLNTHLKVPAEYLTSYQEWNLISYYGTQTENYYFLDVTAI